MARNCTDYHIFRADRRNRDGVIARSGFRGLWTQRPIRHCSLWERSGWRSGLARGALHRLGETHRPAQVSPAGGFRQIGPWCHWYIRECTHR